MLKLLALILAVFVFSYLSYPLFFFVNAGIDATLNPGDVLKLFIGIGCIVLFNLGYEIANIIRDEANNKDNENVW